MMMLKFIFFIHGDNWSDLLQIKIGLNNFTQWALLWQFAIEKTCMLLSRFLYTSVRCQTESCLLNLGHLVVASDTSDLPDN